jgi:asparagine synthase (glutamine-hydrolysing)
LPTFLLARETRRHVTVALNGDGGDELFAGYDRYQAAAMAERLVSRVPLSRPIASIAASMLPASAGVRARSGRARRFLSALRLSPGARYAAWIGIFDPALKRATLAPDFLALARSSKADSMLADPVNARNGTPLLNTLLSLDLRTYLPNDLLVKVDIVSMANSLETRSPFLDYRLVEWAATLPTELKRRGQISKYLLKRAFADILPQNIVGRPKAGFGVPVADWLRGDLRPMLEELLLTDRFRKRGYFNQVAVYDMVSQHTQGRADWWQPLWSLMMLELWHQEFIDRGEAA